ncbi:MAG: tetratricopeptide repeat protein [Gemmatimonadetes bacterium]|nr:tetratricopeptide repeat protein [Gemmatimonadota bacterium]
MSRRLVTGSVFLFAVACGGGGQETAVDRGDQLLAAGHAEAAVAEYKLALRQFGPEPDILLRLGHAFAATGDVDASLEYLRPLLESGSEHQFQVAAELSEAARVARERGSPDNMARAMEPVLSLGIGMVPEDLRYSLAGYYAEFSDWNRAIPLYLAVLEGEEPPSEAVLETARAFQEVGGCREALAYFEQYLETASRRIRAEIAWEYGSCLYEVAIADRAQGRPGDAADKLDLLIDQGVPRNLLDKAHYNRGEIRLQFGDLAGAESDFLAVLELNPVRTGSLVRLAEERIREIRFGVR